MTKFSSFQPGGHREPFLEGSWADIFCTQLYYICFIWVLIGGLLGYSGLLYKKVENHWPSLKTGQTIVGS